MKGLERYKGKKVLVTGAGGFIGSHLVELLVECGAVVRAFVRYNSRADIGLLADVPPSTLEQVEIQFGDLRDGDAMVDASNGVDIVLHLGAFIAIPYSYVRAREVIDTNVTGTLNVMTAARRNGISRVVHASTSEIYGTAQAVPIAETHRVHPQSPYAASKAAADHIAASFFHSFGVPVTTLRPFNCYGPRQSPRAVIPTIMMQCLANAPAIRLGALDPTRDFTFVRDTARAFAQAGVAEGVEGLVINAGSGREISIGDLARLIQSVAGVQVPVRSDGRRIRPAESEVERLLSDSSLAAKVLGWRPEVGLNEGLSRTADWIRQRLARLQPDKYYL